MSGEQDPKDGDLSGPPPELVPYLQKVAWPEAPKLGDDPELDKAVAAFKERDSRLGPSEPPSEQDPARGVGNASAYASGVVLPTAKGRPEELDAPKVGLVMLDVPQELPEGDRTRETVERRVLRRDPEPAEEEDDTTLRQEPKGSSVAGTERLPVLKPTAPAEEGGTVPLAPVELPSTRAPSAPQGAASQPTAGTRGRGRGLALAGAALIVALLVGLRIGTTKTKVSTQEAAARPPSSTTVALRVLASPATTSVPEAAPSALAPRPADTHPEPAVPVASTVAPPAAPTDRAGNQPPPSKRGFPHDPHADAAVAPVPPATSGPVVAPPAPPPPVPPTVPPTAAPPPPPTAPSAAPPSPAPKPSASTNPYAKPNYD